MSILSSVTQKMNQLRLEADDSAAKVEELQTKVKTLEQENLSKEQDITSLQHKNGLLEGEVEKLETAIKDFKKAAEDGTQHSTTNESLTRRLQLLEEEAEEADKTLREANEKWVAQYYTFKSHDYMTWRCLPHCPFPLLSDQPVPARLRPRPVYLWINADTWVFVLQAPANRCQGGTLRAKSPGPRVRARPVGVQVRGDVQEVRRHQEGAGGVPGRDRQHLRCVGKGILPVQLPLPDVCCGVVSGLSSARTERGLVIATACYQCTPVKDVAFLRLGEVFSRMHFRQWLDLVTAHRVDNGIC